MIVAIFLLLAWLAFCIIMLIRPLSVPRRHRLSLPGGTEDQGERSGVREPRRPRPPYWPPRAAAAVPEDTERQESTTSTGHSDAPQQPLRLEDNIA